MKFIPVFLTALVFITLPSAIAASSHLFDISVLIAESGLLSSTAEVPIEAIQALVPIMLNVSQTRKEFDEKRRLWAEKYGITDHMENFGAEVLAKSTEFKNKYRSVSSNLEFVEKQYSDIILNETLTIAEINQAVEQLNDQHPLEMKTLRFLFEEMIHEMKKNASQGDNENALEVTEPKQEVMRAMRMLRRK